MSNKLSDKYQGDSSNTPVSCLMLLVWIVGLVAVGPLLWNLLVWTVFGDLIEHSLGSWSTFNEDDILYFLGYTVFIAFPSSLIAVWAGFRFSRHKTDAARHGTALGFVVLAYLINTFISVLWASNGYPIPEFLEPTPTRQVNAVAFSPDGQLLASLEEVADLYVWDAETGDLVFSSLELSNHNLNFGQVKFSPDGRFLAIQVGAVVVFEVDTFELVQVLHEGMLDVYSQAGDSVFEFDFSPDGERIAVASEDGQAFIWDVETGELQMDLSVSIDTVSDVRHVAYSPNGELIATITTRGYVRFWSATSGEELFLIEDGALRGPLAFSPDSQEVAISHLDTGTVSIWELENQTKTNEIVVSTSDEWPWVRSLMYDETGDMLFAGSFYEPLVVVRDLVTDQDLLRLELEFPLERAAMSADGSRFVTAGADGSLLIWDTATGEVLLAIERPAAD